MYQIEAKINLFPAQSTILAQPHVHEEFFLNLTWVSYTIVLKRAISSRRKLYVSSFSLKMLDFHNIKNRILVW